MAYPIEDKLVIGVASSALFQLAEADGIYRKKGIAAYRRYQHEHENDNLAPGIAFPFVRRLLEFNKLFPAESPIEVVLLSRNDPDTGLRVFNTIEHYKLDITRATFLSGGEPFDYIPAYNISLFLSANAHDVEGAIERGYPAGQVLESRMDEQTGDDELRIAFDFDGVIVDDSAEQVYQQSGMQEFHRHENDEWALPLPQGPLGKLFRQLAALGKLEQSRLAVDPGYHKYIRISIVTARNAPAHKRVVGTLREWDITVDEAFFLGGIDKGRVLEVLRPHIFFDDQKHPHLDASKKYTPSVYIPFGSVNRG